MGVAYYCDSCGKLTREERVRVAVEVTSVFAFGKPIETCRSYCLDCFRKALRALGDEHIHELMVAKGL